MYRKERKISSYQSEGVRYQLLEITVPSENKYYDPWKNVYGYYYYEYQIRLNRKIILSKIPSLCIAHKKFASLVTEDLLQQKFTF